MIKKIGIYTMKNEMIKRNTGLDLLRIIAMFMILTIHFGGWGGAVNSLARDNVNYYWFLPVYFIGQTGTVIFFVLSGYFLHEVNWKKMNTLHNKVCFYSVGLYILLGILQNSKITFIGCIRFLFPLINNQYWFISVYFVLMMLSPLLKKGLDAISKRQFQFAILAIALNNMFLVKANGTVFEGLLPILVGYYIKKYEPMKKLKKTYAITGFGLAMCCYTMERFLVRYMNLEHTQIDAGMRGILLLVAVIFLVDFFLKINISLPVISFVALHVLSIYLITAHPSVSGLLYSTLLKSEQFISESWFVVYYLVANILVFSVCILVDWVVDYPVSKISAKKGRFL